MNKHVNGYLPKIEYWTEKLLKASNIEEHNTALKKIAYFTTRQKVVYGQ